MMIACDNLMIMMIIMLLMIMVIMMIIMLMVIIMIMAITGWRWRRARRGKVNLPKEPSASSDLHVCRGEWGEGFV